MRCEWCWSQVFSCVCSAYLCRRQVLPGGLHPWTRFDGSVTRTELADLVAIVMAPIDVGLVLVCRPVVHEALTGSGLVKLVDRGLYDAGRTTCEESDDGESTDGHRVLLLCGAYLHGRQELTRGFDPPASRCSQLCVVRSSRWMNLSWYLSPYLLA